MESVILFLGGVAVGWLVELMIDYGYWRYQRICTDAEIDLRAAVERLGTANATLKSQVDALTVYREQVPALERAVQTKDAALAQMLARLPAGQPSDGGRNGDAPDHLMRISGIGSKVQLLLRDHGIRTFEQLAVADMSELDAILQKAASRLPLSRHELYLTWIEQAQLAADGDSDELEAVQASSTALDQMAGGGAAAPVRHGR